MRHYFVYKTTNLINGKIYIGQHQTDNLEDGYLGSGINLVRAINKYGKKNFKREILEEVNDSDTLNEREIYYIDYYKSKFGDKVYNISGGGQACSNPFKYMSEERKKEISLKESKARKGKRSGSYGKTWKKSIIPSKEEMEANTKKLIDSSKKKVIVMETEQVFESASEAERFFNIDGICKCCRGVQKSAAGYHFCYLENYDKSTNQWLGKPRGKLGSNFGKKFKKSQEQINRERRASLMRAKPVRCIETGEVFESVRECTKKLDISFSALACILKGGKQKSTKGLHFEYAEKNKVDPLIIIMENLKTFDTFDECCKYLQREASAVNRCLNGDTLTCAGCHLKFYKDFNKDDNPYFNLKPYGLEEPKNMEFHKQRKIQCIETGEVFESMRKCAKKLRISPTSIYRVIHGTQKTAGKLHFKEVE